MHAAKESKSGIDHKSKIPQLFPSFLEFSRLVYGILGNKRISLSACVYMEIRKEFPKRSMKAMQDSTLERNLKISWSVLYFTKLYLFLKIATQTVLQL